MTYRYFSHEIDSSTHYCTKCGRSRVYLQRNRRFVGNRVEPACQEGVTAISHIVRART